jgi:hypothetical protein
MAFPSTALSLTPQGARRRHPPPTTTRQRMTSRSGGDPRDATSKYSNYSRFYFPNEEEINDESLLPSLQRRGGPHPIVTTTAPFTQSHDSTTSVLSPALPLARDAFRATFCRLPACVVEGMRTEDPTDRGTALSSTPKHKRNAEQALPFFGHLDIYPTWNSGAPELDTSAFNPKLGFNSLRIAALSKKVRAPPKRFQGKKDACRASESSQR